MAESPRAATILCSQIGRAHRSRATDTVTVSVAPKPSNAKGGKGLGNECPQKHLHDGTIKREWPEMQETAAAIRFRLAGYSSFSLTSCEDRPQHRAKSHTLMSAPTSGVEFPSAGTLSVCSRRGVALKQASGLRLAVSTGCIRHPRRSILITYLLKVESDRVLQRK